MSTLTLHESDERTFQETHPWIDFELDLRKLPYTLWMLIGEAQSKCQHVAGVPLLPDQAKKLYRVYLTKGVHATTRIEGNTLSEEEVGRLVQGTLKLPKSQRYLGIEVQNIVAACNGIVNELLRKPRIPLTSELICRFNADVLRDLEVDEEVRPGRIRRHSVGVGTYRGVPANDCAFLLSRLCDWLEREFTPPNDELKFTFALLKAILAHLYIAWIHPFGDGNGRTARLIEFFILVQSGVPLPAGHLLSNHYNKTRERYYCELDQSSKAGRGPVSFIEYAVEGFVDGLKEQLDHIRDQQWKVAWENYVHDLFRDKETPASKRRKHLVLDMPEQSLAGKELRNVSPRVAADFALKGEKTLTRDINILLKMGLIVKRGKGYAPHRELILAFLPPRCEEKPEKSDGLLF